MKTRITAYHDVTVRAYVASHTLQQMGAEILPVPREAATWVTLRAGESVVTGLVLGVHPRCLPSEFPIQVGGVALVLLAGDSRADLPADCFGLFRLEAAE